MVEIDWRAAGSSLIVSCCANRRCLSPPASWARTVKHECTRRCWHIGRGGLEPVLADYCRHYNERRPHQGKDNRLLTDSAQASPPVQTSVTDFKASQVRCDATCGGAVRHYYRAA